MNLLKTNKYMVFIAFTYMTLRFLSRSGNFDPTTLKGTNVIVTGASSGIGKETALLYCKWGANVFITARREQLLQEVIDECEEYASENSVFGYIAADMNKLEDTEKVINAAVSKLGGIDTLIINHAYIPTPDHFEFTPENYSELEKIFRINLYSHIHLTGHAMPHLVKSQGRLGLVSSVAGRLGSPYMAPYSATKFAMDGFFSSWDLENFWARKGVSTTIIYPGIVETDITDPSFSALGRLGMDVEKLFSYLPPGDAKECAFEIIKSTSFRLPETYYPQKQRPFLSVLIKHLYPSALKTKFFMKEN